LTGDGGSFDPADALLGSRRGAFNTNESQHLLRLVLRPEIAALSMSGSSLLVAVNALLLKRLRLPG